MVRCIICTSKCLTYNAIMFNVYSRASYSECVAIVSLVTGFTVTFP